MASRGNSSYQVTAKKQHAYLPIASGSTSSQSGEEFHMDGQDLAGKASDTSTGVLAAEEYITLSQAARLAPGRPSSNCVWRWCREGVKAASGQRVRLKHMRFGSRIYTTRLWLHDFGLALAEADAIHFDRPERGASAVDTRPSRRPFRRSSPRNAANESQRRHLEAEQELEEAGL